MLKLVLFFLQHAVIINSVLTLYKFRLTALSAPRCSIVNAIVINVKFTADKLSSLIYDDGGADYDGDDNDVCDNPNLRAGFMHNK